MSVVILDIVNDNVPCREKVAQCECDCGTIKLIRLRGLKENHTLSCGCLQKRSSKERCVRVLVDAKYSKLTVIFIPDPNDTSINRSCIVRY
jgi:hypothetical protein